MKEYIDVMVDLETMGTGPNAAIIAIGAVVFDLNTGELRKTFYEIVSLESSMLAGGDITASTILFWMKQGDTARDEFKRPGSCIASVIGRFSRWVTSLSRWGAHPHWEEHPPIRIWGNGAAFDNVILRSTYERLSLPIPWTFRNDMCFRTIRALWPDVEGTQVGTSHNALDDAKYQALLLMRIMGKLKKSEVHFTPPKRRSRREKCLGLFTRFTKWCKLRIHK